MPTFFFHSDMAGAPTNTNAAGSTLEIIRSCLVTGFNLRSVVSASVSGGVMTLNYAAPHGYEDKVWLRLDGAAGGSIVQRVTTAAGASSLTIPAPGFADGAVAGTLSTRVAPADWEEVFSGTNKAVFRSKVEGPGCTRFFYRISDNSSARFRGFESMTDVDTGIGPFPTVEQESGEGLSFLRANSSTTPRPWCCIADQRTLYIVLASNSTSSSSGGRCFGDFLPYSSADLFNGLTLGGNASYRYLTAASQSHYVPRIAAGTGGSTTGTKFAMFSVSGTYHTYPSSIDGGMTFSRPVLVAQGSTPRGEWRGLICCSANPIPSGQLFTIMESVTGVSGRLMVVRDSGSGSDCAAFPLDEDWA